MAYSQGFHPHHQTLYNEGKMTGLFLDLSDYIPDPEVEAVEYAIKSLQELQEEEYDESLSISCIEGWKEMVKSKTFKYRFIEIENA